MSMTRRDYRKFADTLSRCIQESKENDDSVGDAYVRVVKGLCDVLKYDNPRFNKETFEQYILGRMEP